MRNEIKEGVLILSPKGNILTEYNNAIVMDMIERSIEAGTKKIVFNLSEVDYMNSSGLALLLAALAKARKNSGELVLCCVPDQTKKLLQITCLSSVFMVFAQEENAVAFLKSM